MVSVRPAGLLSDRMWQKLQCCDFLGHYNYMINVRLCMMAVLMKLYPFVPLLVTLIVFQDNSSVQQLQPENLYSLSVKLKLCTIADYISRC